MAEACGKTGRGTGPSLRPGAETRLNTCTEIKRGGRRGKLSPSLKRRVATVSDVKSADWSYGLIEQGCENGGCAVMGRARNAGFK